MLSVLIACLLCGFGFVALATLLMSSKGNTIRDVLSAPNLKDAEAIKIDILNKIKISSNIPIVGLFLVGAIVAIAFPCYFAYIHTPGSSSPLVLVGNIGNYPELVDRINGERIYAFYPDMGIRGDGQFEFPLRNTAALQSVIFESPTINPLTLRIQINHLENQVEVMADAFGDQSQVLKLDGTTIKLPPLRMSRTSFPAKVKVENRPSNPPIVSDEFNSVPAIERDR